MQVPLCLLVVLFLSACGTTMPPDAERQADGTYIGQEDISWRFNGGGGVPVWRCYRYDNAGEIIESLDKATCN